MLKNVAGQKIGAQIVDTDGVAFTGAVTVYVCGDAGTQGAGSVGSGACTHEGNGYHTYAPAQAETNYDLIAFTFIGSGAVPVTVQVYPITEPWSASAERTALGIASANLDTQLSGISAKTTNLPASPAAVGSEMALTSGAVQAIWDALTSALTTVGSIGKRIVDYLDAAISSRSTYAGGDTSGTTTLLSRIVGTLASGTHQPQSGDAYARLGAPAGASVSADVAALADGVNVASINDVPVTGSGTGDDPWGPTP